MLLTNSYILICRNFFLIDKTSNTLGIKADILIQDKKLKIFNKFDLKFPHFTLREVIPVVRRQSVSLHRVYY